MKTVGLIGGLTWLSTLEYYRLLNEQVNAKLGGAEAAKIAMYSVNFAEIKQNTEADRWDLILEMMQDAARKVEGAGADCLLLGANTMHRIADEIQQAVTIPIIHIAEVVARHIKDQQLIKVALLGTKFTMTLDFYKDRLSRQGIEAIIPNEADMDFIHDSIYNEMGKGIFSPATKARTLEIIDTLKQQGAQGAILGCTEIPILIKQEDCSIPVFDTTRIHAHAAINFALGE